MSDSRWITEKRGDVAALLVDALSLIGHQTYLSPEEESTSHNSESTHARTNKQINNIPTLNLQQLNSPITSQNNSNQSSPPINERYSDVVPRLQFKTSPEKRCVQCSYVCVSCGNTLSARDDVKSISVFSDRSTSERVARRTSSVESAKMLLEEYPGVYKYDKKESNDKEVLKRRGFIENSILRSAGLSFDDSRNRQIATLKDDLITKGGFAPTPQVYPCQSSGSDSCSDTSQEGEIVSILCVEPEEYLSAVNSEQKKRNTATVHVKNVPIKHVESDSGSEETLADEAPNFFTNSSLSNPTALAGIKEEKPAPPPVVPILDLKSLNPQPLQDSQLSPFETDESKPPPVNGQRVLPDLGPLLKTPNKPSSPGKNSPTGKRRVSTGFTASEMPQSPGSTGGGRSKGFKKFLGNIWKK